MLCFGLPITSFFDLQPQIPSLASLIVFCYMESKLGSWITRVKRTSAKTPQDSQAKVPKDNNELLIAKTPQDSQAKVPNDKYGLFVLADKPGDELEVVE